MSDTIVCTLWICACNHPASDHDGPHGECQWIIDIDDLGANVCDCQRYEPADPDPKP